MPVVNPRMRAHTVNPYPPSPVSMILPFGFGSTRLIYGGPYQRTMRHVISLKLAPELNMNHKHALDIHDMGIPDTSAAVDRAVMFMLYAMQRNEHPVFVGCMGGKGRTGLFLALLAKTMGVEKPVAYVREFYRPTAIETPEQQIYVHRYCPPLRSWRLAVFRATSMFYGKNPNTTTLMS